MTASEAVAGPLPPAGATTWVEQIGPGAYRGHNGAGATVVMTSPGSPDSFTPGELLKLALAGCVGLTAEAGLARHLGAPGPAVIVVEGRRHPTEERYTELDGHLIVDLAGLTDQTKERLRHLIDLSLAKACTVGLTLAHGVEVQFTLDQA